MPISIKNGEAERLARQLAQLTGEALTETLHTALAERYDRLRQARSGRSLTDELNTIALRCASRPGLSPLDADDILGHDDLGASTQG